MAGAVHATVRICLLATAAMSLSTAARAETEPADDWSVQVTPYVWATGIGGAIRPFAGAPTIEIDKSFTDVLEDLDWGLFLAGQVRRGRVVALADFSHSSSSKEGLVPPGIPAEGRLRQTSLTFVAGYRAVDGERVTLDLLGGARVWWIKTAVSAPAVGVNESPGLDFADPLLAARLSVRLAPRWSATAYADIGIGSRSTLQLLGTVNYRISDHFQISAGYRQLHFDYDSGGARADMRMGGPILGGTFRF